MMQRPINLHASALNDAEYELYTTSLAGITLADEELSDNQNGSDTEIQSDDAYYDRLMVSVREARAWLRGRYSHVAAVTIDNILRFFSPTLSQADTLTGGQFFAVLRLVFHAESGKEIDRTLAFVQAHPARALTSHPASTLPPPLPASRKCLDGAYSSPFTAVTSTQLSQPQPLSPSYKSTPAILKSHDSAFDPMPSKIPPAVPKSHDSAFNPMPSKTPTLPPRKPHPNPPSPIPPSSSAPLGPPPRRDSLLPSKFFSLTSKTTPLSGSSPAAYFPFEPSFGNSNPAPQPQPPYDLSLSTRHLSEFPRISDTGSAMKEAEERFKKDRSRESLMNVLETGPSGNRRPSPFANATPRNPRASTTLIPSTSSSRSPSKWEGSSALLYTNAEKREPLQTEHETFIIVTTSTLFSDCFDKFVP
ncbi:hypothetical protein K435DRAFT_347105 [Dendrothele bispora CBS 962.96]|uniref:Uncharacterized protein n=1 Tax=Dendrothele bispora (strain CBS 962.96) TaxID=1314807 RepID=A0A4S8LFM1_DENBC|nr:hypothetical protein K435DRAFT_347105 [Dendrothele bispora CBS 962.96]